MDIIDLPLAFAQCQPFNEKEVHCESIQSIKNLAGLSPNQFGKKPHRCHAMVMAKFCDVFSNHQLDELTVDSILDFLNQLTDGCKP